MRWKTAAAVWSAAAAVVAPNDQELCYKVFHRLKDQYSTTRAIVCNCRVATSDQQSPFLSRNFSIPALVECQGRIYTRSYDLRGKIGYCFLSGTNAEVNGLSTLDSNSTNGAFISPGDAYKVYSADTVCNQDPKSVEAETEEPTPSEPPGTSTITAHELLIQSQLSASTQLPASSSSSSSDVDDQAMSKQEMNEKEIGAGISEPSLGPSEPRDGAADQSVSRAPSAIPPPELEIDPPRSDPVGPLSSMDQTGGDSEQLGRSRTNGVFVNTEPASSDRGVLYTPVIRMRGSGNLMAPYEFT